MLWVIFFSSASTCLFFSACRLWHRRGWGGGWRSRLPQCHRGLWPRREWGWALSCGDGPWETRPQIQRGGADSLSSRLLLVIGKKRISQISQTVSISKWIRCKQSCSEGLWCKTVCSRWTHQVWIAGELNQMSLKAHSQKVITLHGYKCTPRCLGHCSTRV